MTVLRTLRRSSRDLTRSDLAGMTQTTIRRLAPMLSDLVAEGLVEERVDGLKVLYRAKRTRAYRLW